jgi:hypothetical protein
VCDGDLPRGPFDQRHAGLVLEPPDLLGEGGLRDVLAGGGAGEVALLRKSDQVAKLSKIHKLRL